MFQRTQRPHQVDQNNFNKKYIWARINGSSSFTIFIYWVISKKCLIRDPNYNNFCLHTIIFGGQDLMKLAIMDILFELLINKLATKWYSHNPEFYYLAVEWFEIYAIIITNLEKFSHKNRIKAQIVTSSNCQWWEQC